MKTLNFPLWGNVRRTKGIIITMLMLITITSIAQNGINYKALIKDSSGNVVANQNITVQFTILQGGGLTNVYQETHTPTTDANGIIIINIGEGVVDSGVFATIDWGADDHFLNVQINIGSGLTDMGNTQFKPVPYAINAANVTGLEALDEGNGIGWRLIGRDPTSYGNIGFEATDLSHNNSFSSTNGATGNFSTAIGFSTTASGVPSIAMGQYTIASGQISTAMGGNTIASGQVSTAMGAITTASGDRSTAMGDNTKSEAYASTALGRFNIGGGTPDSWVVTDPLFEVGNGLSNGTRSNALTILKNGTITAPSFDMGEITDNKALITKEYADTNYNSGLEALDEGNGIGWRLVGRDPANYGNIGFYATDLSYSNSASSTKGATGENSIATGRETTASGNWATAMGFTTTASGQYATAMGFQTTASGNSSTAMGINTTASVNTATALGDNTTASGFGSTAMGLNTIASGVNSTAMGQYTNAEAFNVIAVGRYNVGGGTPSSWVVTDALFEVGNGFSDGSRSNALTILKNGTITAPTFDIAEITDNKALITKEYFDANKDSQTLSFNSATNDLVITNGNTVNLSTLSSSGLEAIDEGNGYGWRLIGRDPNNYGNIGLNATDLSFNPNASSTFGATGDYAIAMGALITASGDRSTAMGNVTMASGYSSTAFGANTIASGDYSTSIGNVTTASGIFSTAMGLDTKAEAYNATTFGRYNVGGGTPGSWIPTDKLFEVGNGTGDLNRANAFTILKNGNTGIGTATPNYTLSVNGTINLNEDIGTGIALRVNNSEAIWYDGTFFSWGFGGQANFFADNVGIGFSAPNVALDVNGSIEYTGTITDVSDIRLKENFMPIKNVLERLQKINAYSYNMINDETKKREYGVIAQELQKVFPEMVSVVDTEKGYLGVSYIQLIPIILEAIKEQNKKIEDLKLKLESYKSLEKRINALEANSN